jgi:hypothetical protein
MAARTLLVSLSVGLIVLLALPSAQAQINGVPASVTSFGFGGNMSPAPGVRASVTSLGPNGYGNTPPIFGGHRIGFGNCCFGGGSGFQSNAPLFPRHREHHRSFGYGPILYPAYTEVVVVQPDEVADEDANYDPTYDPRVLRLRLPRESDAEPRQKSASAAAAAPAPEPVVAQPATVLVFKDGHTAEVQNYAIVGQTLFELGDGRTRKIQLAELDLPATQKANDDRGVDFQLPARN